MSASNQTIHAAVFYRQPLVPALASKVRDVCQILQLWQQRSQQRKQLSRLEDHLLEDIGISRSNALREAQKPFWRA